MLDLLIAIFITTGTQFTQINDGKLAISIDSAERLKSSSDFQRVIDDAIDANDVIVMDDIDPITATDDKE